MWLVLPDIQYRGGLVESVDIVERVGTGKRLNLGLNGGVLTH